MWVFTHVSGRGVESCGASDVPELTVERAILDRFGEVIGTDRLGRIEIGDGAADLQNLVVGTGREPERCHRLLQKLLRLGIERAVAPDVGGTHVRVLVDALSSAQSRRL